jgi:hypothetical protein
MPFSTYDQDHDGASEHCARDYGMGWWMNNCFMASPTGVYHSDGAVYHEQPVMQWWTWHNNSKALKTMDMKIRPVSA